MASRFRQKVTAYRRFVAGFPRHGQDRPPHGPAFIEYASDMADHGLYAPEILREDAGARGWFALDKADCRVGRDAFSGRLRRWRLLAQGGLLVAISGVLLAAWAVLALLAWTDWAGLPDGAGRLQGPLWGLGVAIAGAAGILLFESREQVLHVDRYGIRLRTWGRGVRIPYRLVDCVQRGLDASGLLDEETPAPAERLRASWVVAGVFLGAFTGLGVAVIVGFRIAPAWGWATAGGAVGATIVASVLLRRAMRPAFLQLPRARLRYYLRLRLRDGRHVRVAVSKRPELLDRIEDFIEARLGHPPARHRPAPSSEEPAESADRGGLRRSG